MSKDFCKQTPCNNCPYRTDAPLQHWDIAEYEKLLQMERDTFGTVYGCHKNDGKACTGSVIKQDEQRFPSIALRLQIIQLKITREFLDSLYSPAPLYPTVLAMCRANYPDRF